MKLEAVGTIIVRFSSVAFLLKGVAGLANLAWFYSNLHRAVAANPAMKAGFEQSLKVGLWSIFQALACGVIGWSVSRALGKLLAKGLDDRDASAAGVMPALQVAPAND